MRKNTRFLRTICGVALVALFLTGCGKDLDSPIISDSPEQPTAVPTAEPAENRQAFTMDEPASYPVLNSIVDNPLEAFSDERNFLKIMEVGADGANGHYLDTMELEAGRNYSILIHVHNDADDELGENGLAKDVGFTLSCPVVVNGDGEISVVVTAENTKPLIVGDTVKVHSNEELLITFADSEGLYPVKAYNYAMKNVTNLAVTETTDVGVSTITGNIGSLGPGYTAGSGAYVYLWFSVSSATQ